MKTNSEDAGEVRTGLHLVWWETPHGDEPGSWRGQLAGAANRVRVLTEGLKQAARRRDVSKGLSELTYHLENYFVRIYELRERAIPLVEWVTGVKLSAAKNRGKRAGAVARIPHSFADIADRFEQLLALLDDDIATRNEHTHSRFLSLQLVIPPSHVHDPENVLLETTNHPFNVGVRRVLRREIKRLAIEHGEKAQLISTCAWSLLQASDRHVVGPTG